MINAANCTPAPNFPNLNDPLQAGYIKLGVAPNQITYSFYAGQITCSALPLTLISFTASSIGGGYTNLNWVTGSESNTSHFIVQRSTNAINWTDNGIEPAVLIVVVQLHITLQLQRQIRVQTIITGLKWLTLMVIIPTQ